MGTLTTATKCIILWQGDTRLVPRPLLLLTEGEAKNEEKKIKTPALPGKQYIEYPFAESRSPKEIAQSGSMERGFLLCL